MFHCDRILAARGESTIGRVPSAAGADARRRDAGDAGISSRSANAADAPAPPESFGRILMLGQAPRMGARDSTRPVGIRCQKPTTCSCM